MLDRDAVLEPVHLRTEQASYMVCTSSIKPRDRKRLRNTSSLHARLQEHITEFHQRNPLACCFFLTINTKNNVSMVESYLRTAVTQHQLLTLPKNVREGLVLSCFVLYVVFLWGRC